MARDLETAGLGRDQNVFVALGCGQRPGRIQLHQILFEHIFNIRPCPHSPSPVWRVIANGQHHIDPDNTSRPKSQRAD
jgi:hypothetical protein